MEKLVLESFINALWKHKILMNWVYDSCSLKWPVSFTLDKSLYIYSFIFLLALDI
jgi:hypothetical protein